MYNANRQNVTILINSCDLYEDAWEPGIDLMMLQWKNCQFPIVLNTETKEYRGKHENVRTIYPNTKTLTWSQRFKYVLEQIDTPYVLFTLEDYFLLSEVNTSIFDEAVNVLNNNNNIGMICLSHTGRENINSGEWENENFYSRVIDPKCMIWCRICLYRRDFLLKIIKMHESIWEFEQYAAYRARKTNYLILQQNNNERETFTFKVKIEEGYGITARKWLPKNVELFQQYNIPVNYENLGIWNDNTGEKEITAVYEANGTEKIREFLYGIKHSIKVTKRKIIKQIRKMKSTW